MRLDKTKVEMLRRAFIDVVQDIRKGMQEADIRGFNVRIEATGRTFNGDAHVTTTVGTSEYSGSEAVRSPDMSAAYIEAMRRKGFDVSNEQLALPAPGTELEDEQVS
jgi:hypothetical protein